ncbi:MAG: hypothetical protein GY847_35980 [Proteobacteria bacterium]|nr:hypothetical protein [Pseudomonadota bacterium]
MNNFEKLIGKKCIYVNGEFETTYDFNAIDCTIQAVDLIVEDKWPYGAHVKVKIQPLNLRELQPEDADEILQGVPLDTLYDIEWE